jgi:hypothetical protein
MTNDHAIPCVGLRGAGKFSAEHSPQRDVRAEPEFCTRRYRHQDTAQRGKLTSTGRSFGECLSKKDAIDVANQPAASIGSHLSLLKIPSGHGSVFR